MAIKHIAKETPVSIERLMAAKAIGRSMVKPITLTYGFTSEKSNFVAFNILLIIFTFLACKYNDFINGSRFNVQASKCSNIFSFDQSFKTSRKSTNTHSFRLQVSGQFIYTALDDTEHIYKFILAAGEKKFPI